MRVRTMGAHCWGRRRYGDEVAARRGEPAVPQPGAAGHGAHITAATSRSAAAADTALPLAVQQYVSTLVQVLDDHALDAGDGRRGGRAAAAEAVEVRTDDTGEDLELPDDHPDRRGAALGLAAESTRVRFLVGCIGDVARIAEARTRMSVSGLHGSDDGYQQHATSDEPGKSASSPGKSSFFG